MPERLCATCGTDLPSEAAYCLKCGTAVSESTGGETDPLLTALENAAGAQYEIMRLLGRGGMGAVYLARERALDRLVAIKVLPPELYDDENIERFRREAKTAAKLTHPNIVPLHTFGETEGMMYFVMGFIQGESLSARLKRKSRLEAGDVRRILVEVAGALHYAHEHGVVHRDIKPDNILIEDETGNAMLTDFGVAKSVASGETLTQLGTALGTPYYMSPEQAAADKEIDGRSDLYSLGIVGYQLLSGRLPFEGESIREVLVQHVTKEPPPLEALAPTAPLDLLDVISLCLTKEPDARIRDGHTIQRALRVGSDGEATIPQDLQEAVAYLKPLPWVLGGCLYLSYGFAVWGHWVGMAGFSALGALLTLAAVDEKRRGNAKRYSWKALIYNVMRKPRWWTMWWPEKLRQPGDLWDRLPRPVRLYRKVFGPAVAGFLLAIPILMKALLGSPSLFALEVVLPVAVLGVAVPATAGLVWSQLRLTSWAKLEGVSRRDLSSLMDAGDEHPIWKKPHISKLLSPPPCDLETGALPAPKAPEELLSALSEVARSLDGVAGNVASEATAAGRDLLAAIASIDEQIERLVQDVDPGERSRLEEKLQALGEDSATESAGRRQMRELLKQQVELAGKLAKQLESAQERRSHLLDLLKTLWMQIANLRAHQHDAAFDSSGISGRIRALSNDAKLYVEASEETASWLEGA